MFKHLGLSLEATVHVHSILNLYGVAGVQPCLSQIKITTEFNSL